MARTSAAQRYDDIDEEDRGGGGKGLAAVGKRAGRVLGCLECVLFCILQYITHERSMTCTCL